MGFLSNLFDRASPDPGNTVDDDSAFEAAVGRTISEMKADLNDALRASAEAASRSNRLEAERNRLLRRAGEWENAAKRAICQNDEGSAKSALTRKAECDFRLSEMSGTAVAARRHSEELRGRARSLRRQIGDAERNASTLIARKNAVRAQNKVAEALADPTDSDSAFAALKVFERSVTRPEGAAAATAATSGSAADAPPVDFVPEPSAVEAELERLKAEIARHKPDTPDA